MPHGRGVAVAAGLGLLSWVHLPPGSTVVQRILPGGAVLRAVHVGGRPAPDASTGEEVGSMHGTRKRPSPPDPPTAPSPAYPPYPPYPAYPPAAEEAPRMPRERIPSPDPLAANTGAGVRAQTDPEPDDPQATRRYSLLEHATRCALVHELAGRDDARRAFVAWEDQLRQRQAQAVTDVWRRVGRYLLGAGLSGERDWGPLTWRRLYLTEVAPWTDYAEGDEYRFLGMPVPPPAGDR